VYSEEERVLNFPNGEEGRLFVSKVGSGRFRIEDFFRFCLLSEDFSSDLPEDAGFGWIIEVEELEDGRLRVVRVVPDPNIESLSGVLIPPDFPDSLEFERFSAALIAIGGKWEVCAKGLFSAYAPKRKPKGNRFSLEHDFKNALKDWIRRPGGPAPVRQLA
jgi:hypothetical protein